ncbi:uncharacterized protein LAJ45_00467 [Morchella importuna]|uniref:uncharacterized protein n=1 Tax=Morchella importuna TaxID=1174673 RepID=UPI001E8E7F58|nr:uncharacterized protein LAJ45_00467 [Morchella importuna]KAH8155457.1 hypothetical protein LAJ45_00467 [Morchella importuna]
MISQIQEQIIFPCTNAAHRQVLPVPVKRDDRSPPSGHMPDPTGFLHKDFLAPGNPNDIPPLRQFAMATNSSPARRFRSLSISKHLPSL